jgi:glycosyltransferase involved in cell wall biosynthesis
MRLLKNMSLKNISISVFVHSLQDHGAARVALNLAQGFAERGLEVDLVMTIAAGAFLEKVPSEIRLIDLKATKKPQNLSKMLALYHYLRREKPTFLISVGDNSNTAGWARSLARVKTRVVAGVHNHLSIYLPNEHKAISKNILPYLLRWSFLQADRIVAVSQGVAEDLSHTAGLPLEDIRVVYNPVVTFDLHKKAKEMLDHPWFAPGEPPVILGAGRLVKQKDFPTLIRAFSLLRQNRLARLMIVGEGGERSRLEAMVQELNLENDVTLPGFVENPYAYMDRAAVFVLSSRWEGLPTVLIEAMACGCPVIATDCPSGPREILEAGKYGSLVALGDVESLAEAIVATLEHPADTALLQQRAQMYTVAGVVNQYLDLMKSIDAPTIPQYGGV